jgi:hypothetical protein
LGFLRVGELSASTSSPIAFMAAVMRLSSSLLSMGMILVPASAGYIRKGSGVEAKKNNSCRTLFDRRISDSSFIR